MRRATGRPDCDECAVIAQVQVLLYHLLRTPLLLLFAFGVELLGYFFDQFFHLLKAIPLLLYVFNVRSSFDAYLVPLLELLEPDLFSLVGHELDVFSKIIELVHHLFEDRAVDPEEFAVHPAAVGVEPFAIEYDIRFSKHGPLAVVLSRFNGFHTARQQEEHFTGASPFFDQVGVHLDSHGLELEDIVSVESLVSVLKDAHQADGLDEEVVGNLGFKVGRKDVEQLFDVVLLRQEDEVGVLVCDLEEVLDLLLQLLGDGLLLGEFLNYLVAGLSAVVARRGRREHIAQLRNNI
mmetsp:Transcript_2076/g.3127  ORF Transcript_2076/g.3127 Transcript_2076/m.3127 type:complete len:293 (-) Transcript_2076:182-1060(-)